MATASVYKKFILKLNTGETFNWESDTIKVALLTSAYTPDEANDEFFSDVEANEVTGNGYTAGGEILSNTQVTYDSGNDQYILTADNVTWTNATITARYAVIYKDTGDSSTSPLIAYTDFGNDVGITNLDFTLIMPVTGLVGYKFS